jgi:dTDP-4-dehydrorhamnose reductase
MRVLILGGDGMLGHRLLAHLAPRHEVRVTLRRPLDDYARFGLFDRNNSLPDVDVRDAAALDRAVAGFAPDAVVNATGIVKRRADPRIDITSMEVNAIAPHLVQRVCRGRRARLVHLSTDCVFSGKKGNYSEQDRPDPEDVYGLSKLLGETGGPGVLTLRTSMIGPELDRKTGLVEWFLSRRDAAEPVSGWRRAVFSGFTTAELARLIEMLLTRHPAAAGLYHASAAAISKYDLLAGLERRLGLGIAIEPADEPVIDRSLDSTRFRAAFGYAPPAWDAMLDELAADLLKAAA